MLRLQNVSLVRGVRVLYKNVNLTTSDGEIIGLVGPNGSGKSTLFAAILGELSTEDGDILAPPLNRISHVAQRVVETDLPALEYILEGHAPLMEAKAELKRAEEAGDDMAYAQAVAHLAEINEGAVVAKAEEILAKDFGIVPIFNYVNPRLVKPYVKGYSGKDPQDHIYLRNLYIIKH